MKLIKRLIWVIITLLSICLTIIPLGIYWIFTGEDILYNKLLPFLIQLFENWVNK